MSHGRKHFNPRSFNLDANERAALEQFRSGTWAKSKAGHEQVEHLSCCGFLQRNDFLDPSWHYHPTDKLDQHLDKLHKRINHGFEYRLTRRGAAALRVSYRPEVKISKQNNIERYLDILGDARND